MQIKSETANESYLNQQIFRDRGSKVMVIVPVPMSTKHRTATRMVMMNNCIMSPNYLLCYCSTPVVLYFLPSV